MKKKQQAIKPIICEECYINYADMSSKICVGCASYKEHQK